MALTSYYSNVLRCTIISVWSIRDNSYLTYNLFSLLMKKVISSVPSAGSWQSFIGPNRCSCEHHLRTASDSYLIYTAVTTLRANEKRWWPNTQLCFTLTTLQNLNTGFWLQWFFCFDQAFGAVLLHSEKLMLMGNDSIQTCNCTEFPLWWPKLQQSRWDTWPIQSHLLRHQHLSRGQAAPSPR